MPHATEAVPRQLSSSRVPSSVPGFLHRLFRHVLPVARQELRYWTERARQIPDPELRIQALASLAKKRFHADGGCVYAAGDARRLGSLTRLIVALQTISDYLDNLCDRCQSVNTDDFRQLHQAMCDAVDPDRAMSDYYRHRPNRGDGGYLASLVQVCREEVQTLPGYATVKPHVVWLVERYCELQALKHGRPDSRETELIRWWQSYQSDFQDVNWWEFAAATGSTLGVFALFLAATKSISAKEAASIRAHYFPWVCGLHILLDYWIDLEEDQVEGDFNFIRCYPSFETAVERVHMFTANSLHQATQMQSNAQLHRYIVYGLLGMYLSDRKAVEQVQLRPVRKLLWAFGPTAWIMYAACQWYRRIR